MTKLVGRYAYRDGNKIEHVTRETFTARFPDLVWIRTLADGDLVWVDKVPADHPTLAY